MVKKLLGYFMSFLTILGYFWQFLGIFLVFRTSFDHDLGDFKTIFTFSNT